MHRSELEYVNLFIEFVKWRKRHPTRQITSRKSSRHPEPVPFVGPMTPRGGRHDVRILLNGDAIFPTPEHWRDTDIRIEGPAVEWLQAAFVEN